MPIAWIPEPPAPLPLIDSDAEMKRFPLLWARIPSPAEPETVPEATMPSVPEPSFFA